MGINMKKLSVKLCACLCLMAICVNVLIVCVGCSKNAKGISSSELSGTWESESGIAVYEFSDNGTGYAYTKKNPDTKLNFSYTIGNESITIESSLPGHAGKKNKTDLTISKENGNVILYNTNKNNEKIVKKS